MCCGSEQKRRTNKILTLTDILPYHRSFPSIDVPFRFNFAYVILNEMMDLTFRKYAATARKHLYDDKTFTLLSLNQLWYVFTLYSCSRIAAIRLMVNSVVNSERLILLLEHFGKLFTYQWFYNNHWRQQHPCDLLYP